MSLHPWRLLRPGDPSASCTDLPSVCSQRPNCSLTVIPVFPPHTVTSAEELLKDFMSNLGFSEGAWKHNSGYYPTVIERNYLATTHLPSSVLSAEHYPPVMLTPLQCSRFSGD